MMAGGGTESWRTSSVHGADHPAAASEDRPTTVQRHVRIVVSALSHWPAVAALTARQLLDRSGFRSNGRPAGRDLLRLPSEPEEHSDFFEGLGRHHEKLTIEAHSFRFYRPVQAMAANPASDPRLIVPVLGPWLR